jgi:hypothetical protein
MKTTLELACEASCSVPALDGKSWCVPPNIEKLVTLVRADQTAVCLEIADHCADANMNAAMAANAIRALTPT